MHRALAEAIDTEFCVARRKLMAGDALRAFTHLERAYVRGQKHTPAHMRAHWAMLRHAWQYGRLDTWSARLDGSLGTSLFTTAWVPEGNTGGTNVGAFEKLPAPPELWRLISPPARKNR